MPGARLAAIAIDCADPLTLSDFYRGVLNLEVASSSPELVRLEGDGVALNFERVEEYRRPTWPDDLTPKQMHLDLAVTDLDVEEARIIGLGAVRCEHQPDPDQWRVLLDPAGHPFCLVTHGPR